MNCLVKPKSHVSSNWTYDYYRNADIEKDKCFYMTKLTRQKENYPKKRLKEPKVAEKRGCLCKNLYKTPN